MERFAEAPGDTPLTPVPADYSAGAPRRWFVLERGPDAGKKMFFFDTRPGGGEGPTVLFVHGNPECSYTYRMVIKALARSRNPAGTRIVAMDHIGFGLSDQASHEMVDKHHAGNLAQLVERSTCAMSPWSYTTGGARSGSGPCCSRARSGWRTWWC